jgi:hypothetical protein
MFLARPNVSVCHFNHAADTHRVHRTKHNTGHGEPASRVKGIVSKRAGSLYP